MVEVLWNFSLSMLFKKETLYVDLHDVVSVALGVFPVAKVNRMYNRVIAGFRSKDKMVWIFFVDIVECKCWRYGIHVPMHSNAGDIFTGSRIRQNLTIKNTLIRNKINTRYQSRQWSEDRRFKSSFLYAANDLDKILTIFCNDNVLHYRISPVGQQKPLII